MSQPFVIESGVPLPANRLGGRHSPTGDAICALAKANIGDSVFIPNTTAAKLSPYIAKAGGKGWHCSRTVEGGARVWKIAEPKMPDLKVAA